MLRQSNLIVLAIVLALGPVVYYFTVALPEHNSEIIKLEKQKLEMQKEKDLQAKIEKDKETSDKAQNESIRQTQLYACRSVVENRVDTYMKLNGTPVPGQPGVYSYSSYIGADMERIKKDGYSDCERMYGTFQ